MVATAAIVLLAAGGAFAQAPPPPTPAAPPITPDPGMPPPPPAPAPPTPESGAPTQREAPAPFPPPPFPQTPLVAPPPRLLPPGAQPDTRPLVLRGFVRVEGEYNDNFFRTPDHAKSDYREILTPGVSLRLLSGGDEANLAYSPSLVHSSVAEDDILLFHLLDANGTLALTDRLTLRATEHFMVTDEPTFADPLNLRRVRSVVTTEVFGAALTYERPTWSLTPRYNLTLIDYDTSGTSGGGAAQATAANERNEIHVLGLDGTLRVHERNVLGAGYEYTIGEFRVARDFTGHLGRVSASRELGPRTTASATASVAHRDPDGTSSYNIYRGDVGIRRELQPRYVLEARIGYFDTDAIRGSEGRGPEYTVRAIYAGPWLTLTATSSRTLVETFTDTLNAGVVRLQLTSLEARAEAGHGLTLTLRGAHTQSTFLQASALAIATGIATSKTREDTALETAVELAYKLTRTLTLSARYARVSLDSNVHAVEYVGNRVGLALTATFE